MITKNILFFFFLFLLLLYFDFQNRRSIKRIIHLQYVHTESQCSIFLLESTNTVRYIY